STATAACIASCAAAAGCDDDGIAEHDVVLFGATGYTGALTAEYLAAHAGESTRWALAGRNRGKLEALSQRLDVDVPLLHADLTPHDLGVLFTVEQLPEGVPLRVEGFVRAGGSPSGGTFHSAITAFSRVRQTAQAHRERRAAEGQGDGGRRVSSVRPAPKREA